MATAIIAILLMFLVFAALPLVLCLIYKIFYDNHVNKSLQGEKPLKKWLSPIGLFVIIFAVEILLAVGAGSSASVRIEQVSAGEIDQTILNALDGGEASGFSLQDYSQGDFSCQVYKNTQDALLPAYVIRLSYTGDKDYGCWDTSISGSFGEFGFLGDFEDPEDRTTYFLLSNEAMEITGFTIISNVYEEDMDAYSTGNLGTIVTPDPEESISITVE